ncbi:lipocalin family protein [Chryseobacterium sp.]|uniref:lipocalin family protein n=1 Tax=Chryseobacterium sp. TaxID=1871047 RepID=UPI0032196759
MKKQLLLFAFSALAFTSCKDDNLEAYETGILQGDWKEVKTEIISGKDNKTVLQKTTPEGCTAKNTLFFRTDYYVSYTAYDGSADGSDCHFAAKNEGKYTYDAGSKIIDIQLKGEEDEPDHMIFRVDMLTQTELRLAQTVGNYDKDGDKIIDVTYITYKR